MSRVQWWLAELDRYGVGRPVDGPHSSRKGVEQAMYLYQRLGLAKKNEHGFACAEVRLSDVEAKPHGANEDALSTLNAAGPGPLATTEPEEEG